MKISNSLRPLAALACAVLLLAPAIEGRTKKGDRLLKLGEKAENQKDYDTALNYYDQALDTDTSEPAYLLADQTVRGKAAQVHVTQGRNLQQQQKLEEALLQFQKAFLADPSSQIALQEIRQTTEMIKERTKAPAGTPILTPAEKARQLVENRVASLEGPPTLRPLNDQISSLKMNNQPSRVLYESLGKVAGINVLFDPAGIDTTPGKNFNLDLNNVTLEEALSYVSLVTHTFWKAISRNAIFVTQETDQKRREYQDEVVKVFYIQNASTPTEFTEMFNGVRTGAKLTTGVFSVPSQNAIIARGTPDTISLIEKLVHDLDKPKPEVIIDVIVMEINKVKTTTIGAALAGQGGLSLPINFTPRNPVGSATTSTGTTGTGTTGTGTTGTGTTGTGVASTSTGQFTTLAQTGHLSSADFALSLPSTIVQALLSDNTTHVLQRPQLRATDGGTASLKIGEKIPYVSGSLNSAVATPGSIPYATTQFQQIDVGTQIDLKPHVNGPEDISMHIKVEISNVLQDISIAGIEEPEIGQQVDEADIRMKDGEVSILGGLSDKELSTSLSGLPGFTNIPLLGYLFGTKSKTNTDNEILIALIPHIVRAPDLSNIADEGILAGSESVVKVQRRSEAVPVTSVPISPARQPLTIPAAPPAPLAPAPNPGSQRPSTTNPPAQVMPIVGPPMQTPPPVNNPSRPPPQVPINNPPGQANP